MYVIVYDADGMVTIRMKFTYMHQALKFIGEYGLPEGGRIEIR